MIRPCFLVLDPEHPGSISTRKLVIETAKFNVITAYSGAEAIQTVERFTAVDGVVLDGRVLDMPLAALIEQIRKLNKEMPVVVITAPGAGRADGADYIVDSLSPRSLLDVLQQICPGETQAIEKHDRELEADEQ